MGDAANDRLESWKEIAAHLKRDVRTVQRWEKREGLPVYRDAGGSLATIHASRSESCRGHRRPPLHQFVTTIGTTIWKAPSVARMRITFAPRPSESGTRRL